MKITFLTVGKTTDSTLQNLIDVYRGRLKRYLTLEDVCIPELKNAKSMPIAEQKEREGALILRQAGTTDVLLLLDERGREYRSVEFAAFLEKCMLTSAKNVIFVVGGPYGFSEAVYKRADGLISLSKMTFSHQMIRLIFMEQLYRAMTILKGEPYHHE